MRHRAFADNLGAEIIDRWTLPWPEIRVPSYRPGRIGAWELKRQFQPVLRGYFRGPQTAAENYLLTRNDRVWMSLSPVEIESLAPHIPHMHGHVVIAGLGMGLALHNALLRAAVRRITVVECDQGSRVAFSRPLHDCTGRPLVAVPRTGRLSLCRHMGQARRARSSR